LALAQGFAVELLENAANEGLLTAWEDLVQLFTNNKFVTPGYDRALAYANKLADAGYPQMRNALRAETIYT
jgi:hypothetical protein